MCGVLHLGGHRFEIYCEFIDPDWWRPGPPIDLTRFTLGVETGPRPGPWRAELTKVGEILATAGHLRDADLANRLGDVAAEIGNSIAEQAQADVRFSWPPHDSAAA